LLHRVMEAIGPARLHQLLGTDHTQFACRYIAADCASGSNNGIGADTDRGDQRAVRADEGALADYRLVLEIAVVVAGDRARADVRPGADLGIAEVAQVTGLGAFTQHRVLDLDEVADPGPRPQFGPRSQPGERAHRGALAHFAPLEVAEGVDR